MKLAACVLCLSVVATSCYKESIEQLQQQLDELQINSLIQQVAAMQNSVDGLAALKDQLKPAVEKLQEEKSAIEAANAELKKAVDAKDIAAIDKANAELEAAWHAASEDMAKAAQAGQAGPQGPQYGPQGPDNNTPDEQ